MPIARVLLIEDNPANLELMGYLLQAFGHIPLRAHDGHAGLEAARRQQPNLILCDIQLPDMDGYEVVRQIRDDPALAGVPLVAVTAYAMVGDRDKALAAGFDGYMTKPLAPESFVEQIEAFLPPALRSKRAAADTTVGQVARPQTAPRVSVLVIDDSPVNVDLLRGILEPSGYAVQSASSGSEGLRLARRAPFDLIISDLRMPEMDGYDFLRSIKDDAALSHIPVIINSSSAATPRDQAQARALGAALFIERPIEPDRLLGLVEACLNKARAT